jgi:glutamate carboxypeptidase
MHPFLNFAQQNRPKIVELIREMVRCESPSDSPADVNRFVDLMVEATRDCASAETIESPGFGRQLRVTFALPGSPAGQLLALGHSDTVWPVGTLNEMPFREAESRLWGPGVLDMKAGIAFLVFAARLLREFEVPVKRELILLLVSDEEIGSPVSRPLTEAEARKSDSVLVLEPGTGLTGKLKTARKGVGRYLVRIFGKAAHAGVDFPNGASAILEAARQVERLAALTDLGRGTTVNPGVIAGGTRSNVVAAETQIEVDVRVVRAEDSEAIDREIRGLRPIDERCRISVEGGLNRPPMERTDDIARLFSHAQAIASELGLSIEESSTGGGSDGNFTAALGIPTLDGLGAVGEGAHASNESILVDRIADRIALLAGLIAKLE